MAMEQVGLNVNGKNPWKNCDGLQKLSPAYTVGSVIVFFLCALGLTVCRYETVSTALIALSVGYVIWIVRRASVMVSLFVVAGLLASLSSDLIVGAVFLALVVGTMSGAFLLTTRKLPILVTLLIPIVAVGASYSITHNIEISLLALLFTPASICLAVATRKDSLRTKTLLACMGGFLLAIVACAVFAIWKTTGGLNRSCVLAFVDTARNAVVNFMVQQKEAMLQFLAQQPAEVQTAELVAQIEETLSDDAIKRTVSALFNVFPALITVVTALLAFFAQMLLTAAYGRVGLEKVVTPKMRMLTVSLTAAIVFAICFVLTMLLPDSPALAAAMNLMIMLMPIFLLCGIQTLLAIAQAAPGARLFLIFIMGAMFCYYSGGMLYLLAIFGAYGRISAAIRQKLASRMDSDQGNG
ncbi:MAG: DUF2232 domain-containing protein [Clostridia bacterium]|nr:DUF2232 domain-containing protein [Clostridia bacterium]